MTTYAEGRKHIENLINHGALLGWGETEELTIGILAYSVAFLKKNRAEAVTYSMTIPGIEDTEFGLRIAKDGHVDSGSMKELDRLFG